MSVSFRKPKSIGHRLTPRGVFVVSLVSGLLVGAVLAGPVLAGTVEPPGDAVDGAGDPKATGATYPAWDKILPADDTGDVCNSSRFTCVMNDEAVRDNETGLVWERSPDGTEFGWVTAIFHCANREVGGRKGWHLPMREQLASLVDSSNSSPALPTEHPFQLARFSRYWSATADAGGPASAWSVSFIDGGVFTFAKTSDFFVWCVRGGQSFDGNTHSTLH